MAMPVSSPRAGEPRPPFRRSVRSLVSVQRDPWSISRARSNWRPGAPAPGPQLCWRSGERPSTPVPGCPRLPGSRGQWMAISSSSDSGTTMLGDAPVHESPSGSAVFRRGSSQSGTRRATVHHALHGTLSEALFTTITARFKSLQGAGTPRGAGTSAIHKDGHGSFVDPFAPGTRTPAAFTRHWRHSALADTIGFPFSTNFSQTATA